VYILSCSHAVGNGDVVLLNAWCKTSTWRNCCSTWDFAVFYYCINLQGGPIKNMPLYFCLYLRQLLTDFQNSGRLCGQFAIMWLLCIPPRH